MGHCLNDTYHKIDDTFEKLNLKVHLITTQ